MTTVCPNVRAHELTFSRFGKVLSKRLALCLSVGAVLSLTLTAAAADETLRFSSILHATFVESQDVGDVDGHVMSLTRYSGLARFSDGTAGLCYFVAITQMAQAHFSYTTPLQSVTAQSFCTKQPAPRQ